MKLSGFFLFVFLFACAKKRFKASNKHGDVCETSDNNQLTSLKVKESLHTNSVMKPLGGRQVDR